MSDKAKQVNVRFEGPALAQLRELTTQTGMNLSDVLREAVNTSHWLHQQQKLGHKILIQGADEPPREIIFR